MTNLEIVRAAIARGPVPQPDIFELCPYCENPDHVYGQCESSVPPPWGLWWFEQRLRTGRQKPTTLVMEHVIEAGGLANWDGLIESTKLSNKRLGDALRELFADSQLTEVSRGKYCAAGQDVVIEQDPSMSPTLDLWFTRRQA